MNIVEIKALTKKFKDIIAVDNISLNIEQGEIYGLLGPNGAGKSTTIKIISGLLKKNKGEVLVLGKNIDKHSTFTKQNMGIVPQNITIYSDLTASENVSFFASLYGLKGEKLKKQTQEALEFVDLADKANQFPKSFSGGMKRRLNIACAIAHRPKLIIMDEPTVGIDPQSRNHILESVKKLNQLGCTIIYTTHYMEEVESLCSKIGIIDHGKLIAEGTNAELKSIVSDRKSIIISVDDSSKINTHKLSEIEGVIDVVVIDNILKIANKKEINNWDKIIMLLNKSEVIIKNIESEAPSLETVFLTLTGRKLRD
ncbi:ABC transporter ATP-binding protein [Clostridium sp. 'deep sea']|uniref:ABC transporter ATP-binding protein n=1 Tax=Clostridium sp. 'deep sea' TaxID=2779445 RepID=UPI0018969257|nr:ABC transporter ATP-binding protein [Clostridium sp. 'deep sea']QOR35085.1 ABC transporter ATP-binding protein [Clostridium sp. 'deep sea']